MSASVHTDLRMADAALLERYRSVRQATDLLRAPLTAEDQMVQSMPDCSPAKWHAAHTTWFFETFLLSSAPWYKPFNPRFRDVFNSYYKQVGEHPFRGDRGTFSHPTLDEVRQYRHHVDACMERLISSGLSSEQSALIELGLNHEQQHQELILTDIKHAFWSQPLRPSYAPRQTDTAPHSSGELRFISFQGGLVQIGHSEDSFSFDNELPRHTSFLQPFWLASRPVTNGEYIAFMNDDGYSRPELWLSDGWDTVNRLGWKAPLYWEKSAGEWKYFTLGGPSSIDLREPVCHISLYEADAYARWSGARLPTEAEWEHAAASAVVEGNFADDQRFHPAPASSGAALQQLFGDVWEWTGSAYLAYPGFQPAEGVVGEYNGKFMCNQFVLRGGSCATPRSHIRATYRNFFPPHARWQFTGVRLAKDER